MLETVFFKANVLTWQQSMMKNLTRISRILKTCVKSLPLSLQNLIKKMNFCGLYWTLWDMKFLRKKFRRALKVCVHAFKCMTISIFFSDLWRPLNHSTPKSDWPVPSPHNVTSLINENITGIKIQFAAKEWYLNRTP